MKRFFLNRSTPVPQVLAWGTKGYKSYYVAYYKGNYANLAVDNAEIFTANFGRFPLESSGWVATPRSASRSRLTPCLRRQTGSRGREFFDPLPPSLKAVCIAVSCKGGVHKTLLPSFQGTHPHSTPLRRAQKLTEAVRRVLQSFPLDTPPRCRKTKMRAFREGVRFSPPYYWCNQPTDE